MLQQALFAAIPLISTVTRDISNTQLTLCYLLGEQDHTKVRRLDALPKQLSELKPNHTYYFFHEFNSGSHKIQSLGKSLAARSIRLVGINLTRPPDVFFEAGEMPVPPEMVAAYLKQEKLDPSLQASLGGLTLMEAQWLVALAGIRGEVSRHTLAEARSMFPATGGLIQMPAIPDEGYVPDLRIVQYAKAGKKALFDPKADWRLVPRGLVLAGEPGVGKSGAAKWLAHEWGLALYRFASAGIKSKYVGDTEKALNAALRAVERLSPCILLLDEIEKLFASQEDSGVTSSVLAELLTWLQERRGAVVVLMTTNDLNKMPQELCRFPRINRVETLVGVTLREGGALASSLLSTYTLRPNVRKRARTALKSELPSLWQDPGDLVAQAKVASLVNDVVQREMG